MLILIAGPYRSGTNDNPELIRKNMDQLEGVAIPILQKGHVPLIGEWVTLPLMRLAGSKSPGDAIWQDIQYPVAHQLLKKCDAVLRISGDSHGADQDVALAKAMGLPVFFDINQIPDAE